MAKVLGTQPGSALGLLGVEVLCEGYLRTPKTERSGDRARQEGNCRPPIGRSVAFG